MTSDDGRLSAPVTDRVAAISAVLAELGDGGIPIDDIGLRRPTLDDVFLELTGHASATPEPEVAA